MTEAQEQEAVIQYCDWRRIPVFHIPNGGKRGKIEAARLKRQGVRAGVPDLCIPVPSKDKHGLFIEMKKSEGGKVSASQKVWLKILNDLGYQACVCKGYKEAIDVIESYLD